MTELAASTSTSQLEAALGKNGIKAPEGAVERLLGERQWIYRTQRVENLLNKLTEDQLYSVFCAEHHMSSAARLFEFLKRRRCSNSLCTAPSGTLIPFDARAASSWVIEAGAARLVILMTRVL